jgi:hypothetical protein
MTTPQIMQPPGVLLAGPSGSGKTSAIATQLLCGLEVFVLVTEPGGVDSLMDSVTRLKAPVDKLHWAFCPPMSSGWDALEDMIAKINSSDQKQLADIKDLGKRDFRPAAMKFLETLKNFHCDRTSRYYGDVTTWDDTHSFNIDSLTGWSLVAWGATVGYKPTANPGEWGIAQNFIHNMLFKIMSDRKCFFTLTAHIEKEMDEMSGVRRVMVSTIGAKLAPKIPPFFSEFIRARRDMDTAGRARFMWSTISNDMDLKNRALSISDNLPPDFRPIHDAYLRRIQSAGGVSSPPPPTTSGASGPQTAKVAQTAPMKPQAT